MAGDKQNLYILNFYSFFPLNRKLKGEYRRMVNKNNIVLPERIIKFMEAKYRFYELEDEACDFYYGYDFEGVSYKRCVHLRAWIAWFSSVINHLGHYYLVITIGIDKIFNNEEPHFPFGLSSICKQRDIVQLKKAFYEDLYCYNTCKKTKIRQWLNTLITKLTGRDPNGKYDRHYIIDVCGVDIGSNQRIDGKTQLDKLFSKSYYGKEKKQCECVIENLYPFVYGLLFGNENNEVIPKDALRMALKDSFSNNLSERIYAGHKTEVFIHTHHPFEWTQEKEDNRKKKLSDNPMNDKIVFDMFLVMEVKLQLKKIRNNLHQGHPSTIKDALASMSRLIHINPYHLGEYGRRYKMLYKTLGVNDLFESVKEQGVLLSDSKEIEINLRLNQRVHLLTGITVVTSILSLIVSIICCNNSIIFSDMPNLMLNSTGIQSGCLAALSVLLILILIASVIVIVVFSIKSYYKLKDIETVIKNKCD